MLLCVKIVALSVCVCVFKNKIVRTKCQMLSLKSIETCTGVSEYHHSVRRRQETCTKERLTADLGLAFAFVSRKQMVFFPSGFVRARYDLSWTRSYRAVAVSVSNIKKGMQPLSSNKLIMTTNQNDLIIIQSHFCHKEACLFVWGTFLHYRHTVIHLMNFEYF